MFICLYARDREFYKVYIVFVRMLYDNSLIPADVVLVQGQKKRMRKHILFILFC